MSAKPISLRRGYADTAHGQVHYVEAGSGAPLLLLGESPRSHRHFRRVLPLLAGHFRAIAIDTPGYGNSHAAPTPVSVPGVAGCIVDFLDSMQIARTHVLGINTGNKLGSALAADWPHRVDRLVLAGYTHSLIPDQAARNAAIRPIFDAYAPRFQPSADGAHLVRHWLATQAYSSGLWWPPRLVNAAVVTQDDVEGVEAQVIDYLLGWRSVVAMYEAIFDYDLAAAWRRIEAPTLVVEFTSDRERHLGPQAPAVCALMKQASPASFDVTYPLALETDAEALANATLQFLRA